MKILVPTVDYPPIEGGISTVTVQLVRELVARGHSVTVVAPYFPGQEAFDASERATIIRFRGYTMGWLRLLPLWLKVLPLLEDADLLLAINVAYGGVIGYFARRRVPYIAFAYAYEFLKFRNLPVIPAFFRRIYGRARLTVAISQFTRDSLLRFGAVPDNVVTIFPGAVPRTSSPCDRVDSLRKQLGIQSKRVILSVGRLIPRKGHSTLIRALPAVLQRFPDAHAVIVGQGPCLQSLLAEARDLGVLEHVTFPGKLPDADLDALYSLCEVFVLPASADTGGQVEGFGLVFAEAHAHGKPCIGGCSGGIADAILDGETGILVEPGRSDAVANAILRLFDDLALAQQLGETGRRRVERELNWCSFTERLLSQLEVRS